MCLIFHKKWSGTCVSHLCFQCEQMCLTCNLFNSCFICNPRNWVCICIVYVPLVVFVSWIENVNVSCSLCITCILRLLYLTNLLVGYICPTFNGNRQQMGRIHPSKKIIKKLTAKLLRASNNTKSILKHAKVCLDLKGKIPRRKG